MIDLNTLHDTDNNKIVAYFIKDHISPTVLLHEALNYDLDPEDIEQRFNTEDVIQEYWEIATDSNIDDDEELEYEYYTKSDKDSGFPVTVLYLNKNFAIV